MRNESMEKTQEFLEGLTGKWWFILLIPLIFFFAPPFVQKDGFALTDFAKWFGTIGTIAANNFTPAFTPYSPVFNTIAIVVFALVFIFRNKFSRIFSIYTGIMMLFFAITQNTSFTAQHGLGIISSSYLIAPVLSGIWFWEAAANRNDFSFPPKITAWKIAALIFAFFAFWNPIGRNALPDFNPVYLFTNASSTMLCTLTPMILAILFLFYPRVNSAVLRVTGLTGSTIGFLQLIIHFVLSPQDWWIGVLHIPIFTLSLAAVIVSFRIKPLETSSLSPFSRKKVDAAN